MTSKPELNAATGRRAPSWHCNLEERPVKQGRKTCFELYCSFECDLSRLCVCECLHQYKYVELVSLLLPQWRGSVSAAQGRLDYQMHFFLW